MPADGGFRLDDAGFVVAGGRFVYLTAQEHTVLSLLHAARGQVIARERILTTLYPIEADEAEIKIVDVIICKMRKKLEPLGVSIQTAWGRGYRLTLSIKGVAA